MFSPIIKSLHSLRCSQEFEGVVTANTRHEFRIPPPPASRKRRDRNGEKSPAFIIHLEDGAPAISPPATPNDYDTTVDLFRTPAKTSETRIRIVNAESRPNEPTAPIITLKDDDIVTSEFQSNPRNVSSPRPAAFKENSRRPPDIVVPRTLAEHIEHYDPQRQLDMLTEYARVLDRPQSLEEFRERRSRETADLEAGLSVDESLEKTLLVYFKCI